MNIENNKKSFFLQVDKVIKKHYEEIKTTRYHYNTGLLLGKRFFIYAFKSFTLQSILLGFIIFLVVWHQRFIFLKL